MRRFITWSGIAMIVLIVLIAYIFGAKAGRGRYRDIKVTADAIWNDPKVKKARKKAVKKTNKQFNKNRH